MELRSGIRSKSTPARVNILSDPISIDEGKVVLGIDESGKGDFFGPLVVAGVLADGQVFKKLAEIGARDSKKISDNRIKELARYIRENMPYSVVLIGPEKTTSPSDVPLTTSVWFLGVSKTRL